MSDPRDLLLNFERMWREMDELIGDPWQERGWSRQQRAQTGFSPRVDVYYVGSRNSSISSRDSSIGSRPESGPEEARAIVEVELAGIDLESVSLEVSGRELVISGERPVQEIEGRVYQQVEIEAGPFKRVVELGAEVVADRARAGYDEGILRVELPLRAVGEITRRVPIEGVAPEDETG
jgi:HSP20 family protein